MNTPAKAGPMLYALASLAVALGAALILQGWRGSRAADLLRTPPRKITFPQPPYALNPTDGFQIIRDRALFYATRKFYDPVLATSPTTRSQLSSYQLLGTLIVPGRPPVAFLQRGPTGKATTVSPGGDLDGWKVKVIESGHVVFGYENQQVTLSTMLPFGRTPANQRAGIFRLPIARPELRRQSSATRARTSAQ